jgi:hypothetical protein
MAGGGIGESIFCILLFSFGNSASRHRGGKTCSRTNIRT